MRNTERCLEISIPIVQGCMYISYQSGFIIRSSLGRWWVRFSAKTVSQLKTLIVWVGCMPWLKTGATHYYAQLRLQEKSRIVKWWRSRAFGPAQRSGPGCYQPSPYVWFVGSLFKSSLPKHILSCFYGVLRYFSSIPILTTTMQGTRVIPTLRKSY